MLISSLDITGPCDTNTPTVVLIEILESHAIDISQALDTMDIGLLRVKMLRTISRLTPLEFGDSRDYPAMARFVNAKVSWTSGTLRKAFKFLTSKKPIPRQFKAQRQTPQEPYSINARQLYRACRELSIQLNSDTSLEQMATLYRLTKYPPPDVYLYLTTRIAELPQRELVKLLSIVGVEHIELDKERLQTTARQDCNDASDPYQAIVLAAREYCVDISQSLCPTMAYSLVMNSPELFRHPDTRQHPEAYPCLEYHFNPSLPIELYNNNALTSLISLEGLTAVSREDSYDKLQQAAKCPTFQLQGHATTTAVYSEQVDSFPFGCVVYYGDSAISLRELHDTFHNTCSFLNPMSEHGQMFKPEEIRKLTAICQRFPSPDSTDLLATIDRVETILGVCSQQHTQFLRSYHQWDRDIKNKVVEVWKSLHRLAMYMRGWDGNGPLPITSAPVDDQVQVDVRVTEAIIDFDQRLASLPNEIKRTIMDLNLYCYRNGELRVSTPQDTVPSLGLRLELVRGGSDLETIESCIRTSSNYFAATSYYYLKSLGCEPDYDLSKLRYIS